MDLSPSMVGYGGVFPIPMTGSNSGVTGPLLEIQTSPTDFVVVTEIILGKLVGKSGTGNTSFVIGVGRPAAIGVGINPNSFLYNDKGNSTSPPSASIYTWWTKPPTIPANFLRRFTLQLALGQPQIPSFFFGRGIKIQPSSSLVVWLITSANATGVCLIEPSIGLDG